MGRVNVAVHHDKLNRPCQTHTHAHTHTRARARACVT